MESIRNLAVFLPLILTATLISTASTTTKNTTATTKNTTSIPSTTNQHNTQPRKQMENIMDALIGAGDFSNWASILSSADPSILPITATVFVPSDADYDTITSTTATTNTTNNHQQLSPLLLFAYHVIPERLSFSDLCLFPTNTRLPTLLPGFSLLITNNSRSNFSIDGSTITHPDLYQNAAVSAHGISSPFDYTLFGDFDYAAVFGNSTASGGGGSSGGGGAHTPSFGAGDSVGVSGSAAAAAAAALRGPPKADLVIFVIVLASCSLVFHDLGV